MKERTPPRKVVPVEVAKPVVAQAPVRALTRAQILEGLAHPDVREGCLVEDTWSALTEGPLTPETLKIFLELLDDPKLSSNQRTLLLMALHWRTDPQVLAYWRQLVPNAAALDVDPTPDLWAGTPAQIALAALIRHGTAEDLDRLTGFIGTSMRYDRSFVRALKPVKKGDPLPTRALALTQQIFYAQNQHGSVRAAALDTLSALGPPPLDALRAAIAEPATRRVALDAFPLWFRPEDLAMVAALDIPNVYEAGTLDNALALWLRTHAPGAEARAWLETLRSGNSGSRLPRSTLVLGLWASAQQEPELARAAHRAGVQPLGLAASLGSRTAHAACLAALDHRARPIAVPDPKELSYAHPLLNGSAYPEAAKACLAALPPEKAKPKR